MDKEIAATIICRINNLLLRAYTNPNYLIRTTQRVTSQFDIELTELCRDQKIEPVRQSITLLLMTANSSNHSDRFPPPTQAQIDSDIVLSRQIMQAAHDQKKLRPVLKPQPSFRACTLEHYSAQVGYDLSRL